ncbi:MAG: glycosyltransferase family 2 protein [Deltaproteobacteria bacterium]|nr:MAG: glycosyltransferase family 2 protein [Deltaproteobacteria bacterium]
MTSPKDAGPAPRTFRISVVLPVYNEAENLEDLLRRLMTHLLPGDEVIVVDDCSTDASREIAARFDVRLIEHPYNMGNGAAVKSGIRAANNEVIVMMDGDGQHDPEDIDRLLAHLPRFDMVVGARSADSQANTHRWLANRIYSLFASYVTGFPIPDLTSGFRAIKRQIARKYLYLLPNTFSYPTTLTLCLIKTGRSVKFVPIRARARKGKSKIRLLADGSRFLLIIVKIGSIFSPFKVFLPVSAFFFLLGIAYYSYTFITAHRFTNMSMLLFMTSIIVFMLGIIAEQIAQIRLDRSEEEP